MVCCDRVQIVQSVGELEQVEGDAKAAKAVLRLWNYAKGPVDV